MNDYTGRYDMRISGRTTFLVLALIGWGLFLLLEVMSRG